MCVRVDRVWARVIVCMFGQSLGSCECVFTCEHSLLLRVSVCTCGQSLGSCDCVYMRKEFKIM